MYSLKTTPAQYRLSKCEISLKYLALILISLPLAAATSEARAGDSERPNIILLMGDDHGWDETGYNGHPYLKTPVLDEMATNGFRLDRFYAAHPSCSPTRGSVLTGRHPNRYGTFGPGWSIRPEEITIAHLLSQAGYDCSHFGKWHLGPVKSSSPTNPGAMGFDHWLSHDNFFEMNPILSRDGAPPKQYPGEGSEVMVNQAIKYLSQEGRSERPFFVVIWYGSPHEPYSGLPEDLALYEDLPGVFDGQAVRLTSNKTGSQVKRPLGKVLQERYAEISAMDRSIGVLREWLASEGLKQNTMLWYCGDNGSYTDGSVTSPLRGHKGTVYEGGIHVPCVIEWPARTTVQQVVNRNAVTSDIFPTICELLDLSLPERPIDGESLLPGLESSENERGKPICFWDFKPGQNALQGLESYLDPEVQSGTTPLVKLLGGRFTRNFRNLRITSHDSRFYKGPRAILHNHYKLIVDGRSTDQSIQLINLAKDPKEQNNIAASSPRITAELREKLTKWQDSVLKSLAGGDY